MNIEENTKNYLSVAEYNRSEQEAIKKLPNRIIEAFQPVAFQQIGYPVRVVSEADLFKYIDVMHETRFENIFSKLLVGLTKSEFELLQRVTELICRFSESKFGRKSIARGSILRGLNVLRHIRYLFGNTRPRIFEIGPGCGYLGAMLILEGYPYAATDITQAFYLYQNHFWNFISKEKVVDLANPLFADKAFTEVISKEIIHIPWWEFVKVNASLVPQFDIVTANHTLCEMHPYSLGFTLYISQFLLKESGLKVFMFEGWGFDKEYSCAHVNKHFYKQNFAMVHNDSQITIFAPSLGEQKYVKNCLPMYSRSKRWLLHLYRNLSLHNILENLMREKPLFSRSSWEPCKYKSVNNPLSKKVLKSRQTIKNDKIISIEQVNRYYTGLLGSENHLSPDEHFLKLASCELL